MYKTIVTIETITPMFSSGENKSEAEFRITELKALLRSTFREFFEYSSLDDLKKKEEILFGSTEIKAPVSLRYGDKEVVISKNKENMLPHKTHTIFAIPKNKKIRIIFMSRKKELLDLYILILKLASVVGALGKRSRKCMGAFKVLEIKDNKNNNLRIFDSLENMFNEINEDINSISKENKLYYKIKNFEKKPEMDKSVKFIFADNKTDKINVNYAKKITIVKTKFDNNFENKTNIFYNISNLTHMRLEEKNVDVEGEYNKEILGNCSKKISRFASPVYITVYEFDSEQYLIIKELNYDYIYGNKLKKQSGDEEYIQWYIDEIKKIALEAE